MTSIAKTIAWWRKPTIAESEVRRLTARYGSPLRRQHRLAADDYTRPFRFDSGADRRAEVVFAIQDPGGGIWVHAKRNYPRHIYRLPSGGIGWNESVETALLREIAEETALSVRVGRFLGLLEYEFHDEERVAAFASYIFQVHSDGGTPLPDANEKITEFRQVQPHQLAEIAADLRSLNGNRRGWGQWRALAHDLAFEAIMNGK